MLSLRAKTAEISFVEVFVRALRVFAVPLLVLPAPAAAQVPGQAAPGQPASLRPLPLAQIDDGQSGSDLSRTRPISISVSQSTQITDLLLMLVRGTPFSVAPDPDVQGTFRGELKGVTIRRALDIILHPRGFDYRASGNVIRVFRTQLETRRFDLNYVAATRRTGSSSDIFGDLASGVQTLVSGEGRFNIDRRAGLLQVTDYPDRLTQIQGYLDAVWQRAGQQVHVQANIVEVALNERFAGGIDWNQLIGDAGSAVSLIDGAAVLPAGTTAPGLQVRNFAALIDALSRQGRVKIVASPAIYALNNEPALVSMGTRTNSSSPASVNTQAVALTVTSHAGQNGMITMSITPSVTTRAARSRVPIGDALPVVTVREADTVVRIRDSHTVVVAGLLEEGTTRARTDVIILLTPKRVSMR